MNNGLLPFAPSPDCRPVCVRDRSMACHPCNFIYRVVFFQLRVRLSRGTGTRSCPPTKSFVTQHDEHRPSTRFHNSPHTTYCAHQMSRSNADSERCKLVDHPQSWRRPWQPNTCVHRYSSSPVFQSAWKSRTSFFEGRHSWVASQTVCACD